MREWVSEWVSDENEPRSITFYIHSINIQSFSFLLSSFFFFLLSSSFFFFLLLSSSFFFSVGCSAVSESVVLLACLLARLRLADLTACLMA